MQDQITLPDEATAPDHTDGRVHVLADDIAYLRLGIVNAVMCGFPHAGPRRCLITGHARPLRGPLMQSALHRLARDFRRTAIPRRVTR